MVVPVCECEQGKRRSTTSILQCEIPPSLREGRFVDENEGKSECCLCEREGFTAPSLWKCPFVSARKDKALYWLSRSIRSLTSASFELLGYSFTSL